MSKSKHTEAQMIGALKQLEAGRQAEEVAREVGGIDLRLEGEVRRDGCEPGARSQVVAGREHEATEAGGGSELGQRSVAVGDPKKRLGLVGLKAAIEQV